MNLGSWGYRRKCKPESVQLNCFYSVAKSCLALCNPMNSGTQARFLRPSPPPGVCSNARPSSVEINVQSESHEPQVFLPSSLLVMPCATLTSNFTNYPTPELQIFNHYNETGGKQAGHNLWKNDIAQGHHTNWWEPNGSKMADESTSLDIDAQFSSVAQLCPTLCNPTDCSMPGLPVHYQLPEFIQTHVHWVGDAIQPSHPRYNTSAS